VSVDGELVGEIGPGLVVLVGVGRGDSEQQAAKLAAKVARLRVFDDGDGRMDRSLVDTGGSFVVTYWPSEFSQVRGQYQRTNYALGSSADQFLFQFQFSIGAHGAHPF